MPAKYPQELKERAIRMVNAKLQEPDAPSQYAATKTIAHKLGIGHNN